MVIYMYVFKLRLHNNLPAAGRFHLTFTHCLSPLAVYEMLPGVSVPFCHRTLRCVHYICCRTKQGLGSDAVVCMPRQMGTDAYDVRCQMCVRARMHAWCAASQQATITQSVTQTISSAGIYKRSCRQTFCWPRLNTAAVVLCGLVMNSECLSSCHGHEL
jgi:hypothetical protein